MRARTEHACNNAAIEALKQAAWDQYLLTPHANLMVGRDAYRAEIDRIERKYA